MPRFKNRLDINIEKLTNDIFCSISSKDSELDSSDVSDCAEQLSYVITKMCSAFVANKASYSNIAILVGVLESVKRDFCSRMPVLVEECDSNLR